MTPQELLRRYDEGTLTAAEVMLTVLSLTDKRAVTQALELLPQEVSRKVKEYVDHYRPGLRVFRGAPPKIRTIRFVKQWFASAPPGWDEERVRKVIAYYENQTEEEEVAEDEA